MWDEIKIPIKYGSDYKFARQVLQNIGARVTGEYSANEQASWERIGKHFIIKEAKLGPQVTLAALIRNHYEVDLKKNVNNKLWRLAICNYAIGESIKSKWTITNKVTYTNEDIKNTGIELSCAV